MLDTNTSAQPSRLQIAAAFAAIYLIWGSTYLFIRFAVETLPPYTMAGTRFFVSGVILYIFSRLRGATPPLRIHWRSTAIVGALLLFGGNGSVSVAEQLVPSGLAALLVSMVPLWMVLLDWLRRGGVRPSRGVVIGLALGFIGLILLVRPGQSADQNQINLVGVAILIFATISWATGSIYSRHAPMPSSPLLTTGMEMLCGGALLFFASVVTGEWTRINLAAVSARSLFSLGYLILFGSFLAFTAYVYLLKVSTPARVSTYAFVNPVVAVFLGWALGGEPLSLTTVFAAAIIVAGVAVITLYQTKPVGVANDIQVSSAPAE